MDHISPRSVKRLEEELAELERQTSGATEELEEEEAQETEEKEVETSAPLSQEEETFKKRYSDLRRHSQKQSNDLKEALARIEALEKAKNAPELPSAEEAEEWAKANPKAAAIIRALANEQVGTKNDDVNAIKQELERNKQEARIKKAHPDFEDITGQDEFHDWVQKQIQSVQKLVYEGDADDVIWALTLYKKETDVENPNKSAAKAVSKKANSAVPNDDGGKRSFTESQVQKMTLQEYEKNETAIQEAVKNGSFVYDLSGGAR